MYIDKIVIGDHDEGMKRDRLARYGSKLLL